LRSLSGFRYLCHQLAYLVCGRIFLIAGKLDESLGSYQENPAKSMGKQGEEFDSVESKKLAELFIKNLEKLVKYQTAEKVSIPGWTYDSLIYYVAGYS
jgi:hypothetical protein